MYRCLLLFAVVIQIIANLETSETEKMEIEQEIAVKTNSLLRNYSSPERVETISELLSHRFIGAKFGHSVALYFNCESPKELDDLWELMASGRLKDIVEKYVNRLRLTEHQYKVGLKWSADDYAAKQSILNEGVFADCCAISTCLQTINFVASFHFLGLYIL